MRPLSSLVNILRRIDRSGYGAYKEVRGSWRHPNFLLHLEHIQSDPFAPPSRLRVEVKHETARFPQDLYSTPIRRVALEDFLLRRIREQILLCTKGSRGTGGSGRFSVMEFSQCILPRTAVSVTEQAVEAVIYCGLPSAGRRVLGREAEEMLLGELPRLVESSLFYKALPEERLRKHIACAEDTQALREQLKERELVAFVADGAVLPRASGVSDLPLEGAVPFESPPSLSVTLERPNAGPITGMGIPGGVTLIVGGGYHGKSTLLSAIARGIYNHIPGDGREYVATVPEAVVIRAEDGRFICGTDISCFIRNLPDGTDTTSFSTQNASGSTSQSASIVEALEVGGKLLLIDEDTSATNFMIRDEPMRALVSDDKEPIIPFIDRVRQLYEEHAVSTILVMGGSGDYFSVADTVIMMDCYRPRDVTSEARGIGDRFGLLRRNYPSPFGPIPSRRIDFRSIRPRTSRGKFKIKATTVSLLLGESVIDLSKNHHIVETGQVRAIGYLLAYLAEKMTRDGIELPEVLTQVEERLEHEGFLPFLPTRHGNLSLPRRFEIAFALNRLRTLRTR